MAVSTHDLSPRQLQYVVAVAETLGFHKAAERCHVSQPTLSAQVKQLEDVLGVQLFERDRRRVLLTAAGAGSVNLASGGNNIVNGGTLSIIGGDNSVNIGSTSSVTINNGGALDLSGTSETFNGLIVAGFR